jgi:hypothetical protein
LGLHLPDSPAGLLDLERDQLRQVGGEEAGSLVEDISAGLARAF